MFIERDLYSRLCSPLCSARLLQQMGLTQPSPCLRCVLFLQAFHSCRKHSSLNLAQQRKEQTKRRAMLLERAQGELRTLQALKSCPGLPQRWSRNDAGPASCCSLVGQSSLGPWNPWCLSGLAGSPGPALNSCPRGPGQGRAAPGWGSVGATRPAGLWSILSTARAGSWLGSRVGSRVGSLGGAHSIPNL